MPVIVRSFSIEFLLVAVVVSACGSVRYKGEDGPLQRAYREEHPSRSVNAPIEPCRLTPQRSGVSEIAIETTPCLGPCPVYTATLRADGTATYEGRADVEELGHFKGKIAPERFELLAGFLLESGIFDGDHYFACDISDDQVILLSIVRDGKRNTVYHYGWYITGRATLIVAEELIEAEVARIRWKRTLR